MLRDELIRRLQEMPEDAHVSAAYGRTLLWDLKDVQLREDGHSIELVFGEGWYP